MVVEMVFPARGISVLAVIRDMVFPTRGISVLAVVVEMVSRGISGLAVVVEMVSRGISGSRIGISSTGYQCPSSGSRIIVFPALDNIGIILLSSQLAEPLWTDSGFKNRISIRELISALKIKKSASGELISKKSPPPPPQHPHMRGKSHRHHSQDHHHHCNELILWRIG